MGILDKIPLFNNRRIFAKRPTEIRRDVIARIESGEINMNKMQKYTPEEAQVLARFTQEELERLTKPIKTKENAMIKTGTVVIEGIRTVTIEGIDLILQLNENGESIDIIGGKVGNVECVIDGDVNAVNGSVGTIYGGVKGGVGCHVGTIYGGVVGSVQEAGTIYGGVKGNASSGHMYDWDYTNSKGEWK